MTPAFVGRFLQVKMKHVKIPIIILAVSNQTLSQSAIGQQTNRPAPKLMPLVVTMSGWSDAQTQRYGSVQYGMVRFGTEHPDPACVSTAISTIT